MLPKVQRLNRKSFGKYHSQGFFVSSPNLSLRLTKLQNVELSKFSVVVSQKVTKNKPKRNLLKRQLYSILNGFIPQLTSPVAGIFYTKGDFSNMSFSEIKESTQELLKRASLLN